MPGAGNELTALNKLPTLCGEAERYTENYTITRLAPLCKAYLAHSWHSVSVGGINECAKGYYGITDEDGGSFWKKRGS